MKKKTKTYRKHLPCTLMSVEAGLDFVEQLLTELGFEEKYTYEGMMLFEESLIHLVKSAPSDGEIHIKVRKKSQLAEITVSAPGPEMDDPSAALYSSVNTNELDRSSESVIRSVLLNAYRDKIQYFRKGNKYNFIRITVGNPPRQLALRSVMAVVLALVLGLVLHYALPDAGQQALMSYLLIPIESIYMKVLTLVAAPAVFFSIVNATARYLGFMDPGKVGLKVFLGYAATSILAIFTGLGAYRLLSPGTLGQLTGFVAQLDTGGVDSLVDTVVNIVPANLIEPLLKNNTPQVIFAAVFCGAALSRIGSSAKSLKDFFAAMDELFLKLIGFVSGLLPLASFAALLALVMTVETQQLLSFAGMIGTVLLALAVLVVFYLSTVGIVGRVNPVLFLRKCLPVVKECLIRGNMLDVMPRTIRMCRSSLGISGRVASFSVPLGSIVNMDANCVYLTVMALFLSRICGVELHGAELFSVILTVFMLSVGAPIAPGSVNMCISVLVVQMGVSMDALSLSIAFGAMAEMLLAAVNALSCLSVTLTVARSEGLLNDETFNAQPRKR